MILFVTTQKVVFLTNIFAVKGSISLPEQKVLQPVYPEDFFGTIKRKRGMISYYPRTNVPQNDTVVVWNTVALRTSY